MLVVVTVLFNGVGCTRFVWDLLDYEVLMVVKATLDDDKDGSGKLGMENECQNIMLRADRWHLCFCLYVFACMFFPVMRRTSSFVTNERKKEI